MTEEITITSASDSFTATSSGGKSVSAKSVEQLLETSLNDEVLSALIPKTALRLNLEGSDRYDFLRGLKPSDVDSLIEITGEPEDLRGYGDNPKTLSTGNLIDGKPWVWVPTVSTYSEDGEVGLEFGIAPKSISAKSAKSSISLCMSSMGGGFYSAAMWFAGGVSLKHLNADDEGFRFDLSYGAEPGDSFAEIVDSVLRVCIGDLECCPHEECEQGGWEITIDASKNIPFSAIEDAVNHIWTPCKRHRKSNLELTVNNLGDWLWSPKKKRWSRDE